MTPSTRLRVLLPVLAVALGASVAGPAVARAETVGATDAKGAMTLVLVGSNPVFGINDNGLAGSTPGDVRTLSLTMSTPQGREVGLVHVVQTLTRHEAAHDYALDQVVLVLKGGAIVATGTDEFSDFTDPGVAPIDNEHMAITGGTGKYLGAIGTLDFVARPDRTSKWVFRIVSHQ